MAVSDAWLLTLDETTRAAVGLAEIHHLLEEPKFFAVPGSPFYCSSVVIWQNRILPVLDIAAWLRGKTINRIQPLVAVAVHQHYPGAEIQFGALLLSGIPRQIQVDDGQACELPKKPRGWNMLAISCFEYEDKAVPVVDLGYAYSDALLLT